MNNKRRQRLVGLLVLLLGVSTATGLTLYALRQNINLFTTPSELSELSKQSNQSLWLGGYVVAGSVHHQSDGLQVHFVLSDGKAQQKVGFSGVLPDLFREGQAIVCRGQLKPSGVFQAVQVLAKHDENYTPPSLQSLKHKRQA